MAVAQPQPAPHHHAEVKPEQRVREQRAVDPHMGCDRPAEIAGEQERTEDRGRRKPTIGAKIFSSSCPGLTRASTSYFALATKTWMAGTSSAKTRFAL